MKPSARNPFHTQAPGLAVLACLLGAALRVFPLEWNLSLVGAVALFTGARLRPGLAFALPLGLMVVTDALLAQLRSGYTFPYPGMAWVYGSFAVYVLLGRTLGRTENAWRIGTTAVAGSLQFFLVTNFGVWLSGSLYPRTVAGLIDCYVMGIPFHYKTLGGDLLFTAALFGAYAWLKSRAMAPADTLQPAGLQER